MKEMKDLKIAFFEIEPWEKKYISSRLKNFDLYFFEDKLNSKNLKKILDVNVLSTIIYSRINKRVIDSLKSLKYITTRSTGFDHIDLKACKERGILVSNVPSYAENTVAEHTFALILALSRKIYPSLERTKKRDFSLEGLRSFELKGKTLGIVGLGKIGKHVARIAKGFEMNVLACYNTKKDKKFANKFGVKYVSLDYLLKNSDIVTLHAPYNKYTHHLINLDTLKLFKKGCYLINTSRGEICDTTALLKGLEQGVFAGLGLDVLEGEDYIIDKRKILKRVFKKRCDLEMVLKDYILIDRPKVIITPHNAFNSQEALNKLLDITIENIKSFTHGKCINLINKE